MQLTAYSPSCIKHFFNFSLLLFYTNAKGKDSELLKFEGNSLIKRMTPSIEKRSGSFHSLNDVSILFIAALKYLAHKNNPFSRWIIQNGHILPKIKFIHIHFKCFKFMLSIVFSMYLDFMFSQLKESKHLLTNTTQRFYKIHIPLFEFYRN